MIEAKRPGKLFLAGEYSITAKGRKALVMAVDRFIKVTIKESNNKIIRSFGNESVTYRRTDKISIESSYGKWSYIESALNVSEAYLSSIIPDFFDYEIEVISQMEDKDGNKYGIGSSASVTVAIIDAIFKLYSVEIDKLKLFKLSSLATLQNSPNNSCGDIAAVSYTGLVYYRKFDQDHILSKKKSQTTYDLVQEDWPLLEIKRVDFPFAWKVFVGWTGSPASSKSLVNELNSNLNNQENINLYKEFMDKSDVYVDSIHNAIIEIDFEKFKENMTFARRNLQSLDEIFKIGIETDSLRKLSEVADNYKMATKLSGAGGGDCGLAIVNKDFDKVILEKEWKKNGVKLLDMSIYRGK